MIKVNLSRLLGEKRMTQAHLAKSTGIRPGTINDLYHSVADRVSLVHIDRICEYLECDLPELLEHVPNEEKTTGESLLLELHGNQKAK